MERKSSNVWTLKIRSYLYNRPITALLIGLLIMMGCASSQTVSFISYQPPDYDVSLIKSLTVLGFENKQKSQGNIVRSELIQNLMDHGYFSVIEPEDRSPNYSPYLDNAVEAGRHLGVDAVIDGQIVGGVNDRYTTQKNTKRVIDRYKTVIEYESRPFVETIKVRVKEGGEWVEKTKKVTTVKRVPVEKQVPIYVQVTYTDRYLHREGDITVHLRVIDVNSGKILASRSASRSQNYRKLVSSNEPRGKRRTKKKSLVSELLSAVVESAVDGTIKTRGHVPSRKELIHALSAQAARELADQLSPRQISAVRQLKSDDYNKTGVKFARSGQWDQAGRAWRRVRDIEPDNVAAWNNMGVYFENIGQYGDAKDAYEQALDRSPRDRISRQNLMALMSMVEAIQKQSASLGAKIEETSLGLLVSSVLEGTLAERLGLRKGDIIERVDQRRLASLEELDRVITHTTKLGEDLTVDVMRAGESVTLNLTLGNGSSRMVNIPSSDDDEDNASRASFEPVVDVDQVVKSKMRRPDALGVIIGIEDYRYAPSVPYARHDAMVAYEYFVRTLGIKENNIYMRVDRDATQGEFRKVFDPDQGWLAKRIKTDKTEVFIYFVGHGAPDFKTQDAYLIPADGDPNYLTTSFRLDDMYRSLNKLPAKQTTIFIDACFSGQVGRGDRVEMLMAGMRGLAVESRYVAVAPHVVVLTAAHGNQVSSSYPAKSHGLFTYFVFKGLKGHADQNKDNDITVRELYAYVREQVMEQAGFLDREQTPELQGEDVDRILVTY